MAKEYNITRTAGVCGACETPLQPGAAFVATVQETGDDLVRRDYCPACWEGLSDDDRPDVLGLWRTRVPQPEEKKKLFVDNDVLMNFHDRLADAEDPTKTAFRFVLTLILMRKRLLDYQDSAKLDSGDELWTLKVKGQDRTCEVVNPRMDEERIAEVSEHLSEILEGEL